MSAHTPRATYRIQFTPSFGFTSAHAIVDYLERLGVSDLYASPIFKARTGSGHGYDVVDPTQLNPQLGTEEEYLALNGDLRGRGMGWLQDIVPNHMAYNSQNPYLMDVLESGPNSEYLPYFDIEWEHPLEGLRGRVLVPLLGSYYGEILERGELTLGLSENGFHIAYWEQQFPLRLESYSTILSPSLDNLRDALGEENNDYIKFLGILYMVRDMPEFNKTGARAHEMRFVKRLLWELYTGNEAIRDHIDGLLARLNGTPGKPESYDELDAILAEQYFRLCYWKVATEEINYRRFFTVNELISVRVEDSDVFRKTHQLIARELKEARFTGVRVDHLDGLFEPEAYLRRLRAIGGDAYILVEKILEPEEVLPQRFPVQGTTGYTFLNVINGLFVRMDNEASIDRAYRHFALMEESYDKLLMGCKRYVIAKSLAADIARLAVSLRGVSNTLRFGSDITFTGLQFAVSAVIAHLGVYRTYIRNTRISETDRRYIQSAAAAARRANPQYGHEIEFVEDFLLLELPNLSPEDVDDCLYAIKRFQQITGPVMAKGLEDRFLYIFNRLLSLNEVGGSPDHFGRAPREVHDFLKDCHQHWPAALNATATHDTKRGEDTRARLNVLSELPGDFDRLLRRWRDVNLRHKKIVDAHETPGPNAEYFIYQSLLGAMPFGGPEHDDFPARFKEYFVKAMREADQRTSWLSPNEEYEAACLEFIDRLFDQETSAEFWKTFRPFARRVGFFGMWNSLAQTLLKLTSPGVPDIYQGTELWDFAFVDPDNRRPVDFVLRMHLIDELERRCAGNRAGYLREIVSKPEDGRVKLCLMYHTLHLRRDHPEIFRQGEYLPLDAAGERMRHVFAFARRLGERWAIVTVPRLLTDCTKLGQAPLGSSTWRDTRVILPSDAPGRWHNVMTGAEYQGDGELPLAEIHRDFPVGLLISQL